MNSSWDKNWDKIFNEKEWGKYPDVEVIRFIARNFYKVPRRSSVKILDLGCGTGANLWYLAKEGFAATGVDGSKVATDIAKKNLKTLNLPAEIITTDFTSLPFEDHTFDAVIDCACIYANDLSSSRHILKEVHRVIKPQGAFLSLTFSTKTLGFGLGTPVPNEPNTYTNIPEGPLAGTGVARFSSEEDVKSLYKTYFNIDSLEHDQRSLVDRTALIERWIISCKAKQFE